MDESTTKTETTHVWPAPGEHLWGRWFPWDKDHMYRECHHPDCNEIEYKKK